MAKLSSKGKDKLKDSQTNKIGNLSPADQPPSRNVKTSSGRREIVNVRNLGLKKERVSEKD